MNKNVTTQTGAVGASGNYNFNGIYTLPTFDINTLQLPGIERLEMRATVNFSLVKAHGGTIVVCRRDNGTEPEYFIIPENAKNFDRELGKIISMYMLKG